MTGMVRGNTADDKKIEGTTQKIPFKTRRNTHLIKINQLVKKLASKHSLGDNQIESTQ
jgi:hypothetical protein